MKKTTPGRLTTEHTEKTETEPSLGTPSIGSRKSKKKVRFIRREVNRRQTTDDRYFLSKIDGKFIKSKGKQTKKGMAVVGGITFNMKKKNLIEKK